VRGIIKLSKVENKISRYIPFYLVSIFLIPLILIYGFTFSNKSQYYCAFYFPLSIFLALGIQELNIIGIKKVLFSALAVFIITLNVTDFYDFFKKPIYENWRQAAQYIKNIPNYQNKEMVFLFQTRYNLPVFAYYFWQNQLTGYLADNISGHGWYENDALPLSIKQKIYLIEEENERKGYLFETLSHFPEDTWIWVFKYHDVSSYNELMTKNNGRYFIHQINLDEAIPQIDFYLLKKCN
jgi:hypothetical protein